MEQILWYGRGGQGAFSAAKLLGAAYVFSGEGRYALAFPSFGPERRGAPVRAFTKMSEAPIADRSTPSRFDHIVVLDETLAGDVDESMLVEGGSLIVVDADTLQLCTEVLGRPIVNTALLAKLCCETGSLGVDDIERGIEQTLAPRLQKRNIDLVRRVFEQGGM